MGVGLHLLLAQPAFFLLVVSEFIHELGNSCIMNHLQIIGMGALHTITQRIYQNYYALRTNSNLLLIILYTALNCHSLTSFWRACKSQQTPPRNFEKPAWQWHKCVSKHYNGEHSPPWYEGSGPAGDPDVHRTDIRVLCGY